MAAEEAAVGASTSDGTHKLSKAEKAKARKKAAKQHKQALREAQQSNASISAKAPSAPEVEFEYVTAPLESELEDAIEKAASAKASSSTTAGLGVSGLGFAPAEPLEGSTDPAEGLEQLREVFGKFATAEVMMGQAPKPAGDVDEDAPPDAAAAQAPSDAEGSDDDADATEEEKLSKKKLKELSHMKIAELKQNAPRPEVVEIWDVTASDPTLLVWLKSYRNTVPVPMHWSQKRKYLQGKIGMDKPPFQLPDFIEATGVSDVRRTAGNKEDDKKLKQKMRDRMQGKTGKMDLDYQVLHDAFFKHQVPPRMSALGQLYYEGREFECEHKDAVPGVLSKELREALDIEEGGPPPWLINMQRYGPPPSYPNLTIRGLNAPIPPGQSFGYQAGGWGKPPVDETGKPVYGDVFGEYVDEPRLAEEQQLARQPWGAIAEDSSDSESEEESEEEDETGSQPDPELLQDGIASEAFTAGVTSTLGEGLDTPGTIDLRKGVSSVATAAATQQEELYTVLPEQKASVGGGILGTDHTYEMPEKISDKNDRRRLELLAQAGVGKPAEVDVALDPAELEGLTPEQIKVVYDAKVAAHRAERGQEDFSELVAKKAAQQKRKIAATKDKKSEKKFKF